MPLGASRKSHNFIEFTPGSNPPRVVGDVDPLVLQPWTSGLSVGVDALRADRANPSEPLRQ